MAAPLGLGLASRLRQDGSSGAPSPTRIRICWAPCVGTSLFSSGSPSPAESCIRQKPRSGPPSASRTLGGRAICAPQARTSVCRHLVDETSRYYSARSATAAHERPSEPWTVQHIRALERPVRHRALTTFNQGVRSSTLRRPTRKGLLAADLAAFPDPSAIAADAMPTVILNLVQRFAAPEGH